MADTKSQIEQAERLQTLWLDHMEKLLLAGTITSTDLATLARVLLANGWSLDATKLPEKLRNKLTSQLSPDDLGDERLLSIA